MIVFLFVGFALGGVIGALIAVPIAGAVMILMRHLVIEPRQAEAAPQHVEGGILIAGKEMEMEEALKETETGVPSANPR